MKLFEHQEQALNRTQDLNRVAYYHEMGLGKTFTGAEKMYQLGERINLVICQKSKIDDWYNHFYDNYNTKLIIYDLTYKNQLECFIEGEPEDHIIVGIINYELAWRRQELLGIKDFTLMLDESSLIQNERAKQSKFVLKLGDNASAVILLSGTPTGGKYEKLWSQMHLLGWNISKKKYMDQYVEVKYLDNIGYGSIPIVTGYKNVDRLKRKMHEHGCDFVKTDEVYDLPEQMFEQVKVDTTNDYETFMKEDYVVLRTKHHWLGETDLVLVGDTTLTKMLYARELCSIYNENKAQALKDLLESTDETFVVFYNFNGELDIIKKVAEKAGRVVGVVNGSDKSGLKMLNYSLNHNYRYIPIIAAQYKAGAKGLNLQNFSRRLIYFSLPLSSEDFEQSKKRIHRIGQTQSCFYYVLICKNSIEEKIHKTLMKRKDYTEKLFERDY